MAVVLSKNVEVATSIVGFSVVCMVQPGPIVLLQVIMPNEVVLVSNTDVADAVGDGSGAYELLEIVCPKVGWIFGADIETLDVPDSKVVISDTGLVEIPASDVCITW